MISIKVDGVDAVRTMLASTPKQASRAVETALDFTAKHIQSDIQKEMLSVFESPVDYTLKSVKTTLTKGHNMTASVWIATPSRMEQSYLVPQVDGGARKLKGFERGLDDEEFVPGSGAKLNASGNIPVATIKKALVGAQGKRSAEYVHIKEKHGNLWPGVYQRVQTGVGFGAKTKAKFADRSKAYQQGNRKQAVRDPRTGRFRKWFGQDSAFWEGSQIKSVIRARGLKPILIVGRTGHAVKPLLDFYGIANKTFNREFEPRFWSTLDRLLR